MSSRGLLNTLLGVVGELLPSVEESLWSAFKRGTTGTVILAGSLPS